MLLNKQTNKQAVFVFDTRKRPIFLFSRAHVSKCMSVNVQSFPTVAPPGPFFKRDSDRTRQKENRKRNEEREIANAGIGMGKMGIGDDDMI